MSTVAGTFTNASGLSAPLPYMVGNAKLTTVGVDASNTVKTQRSTNNGLTWIDVTTYNSEQSATVLTPAAGEQYRLACVALQAGKQIGYKLTRES